MVDRIFKNWKTTALGIGIIGACLLLVGFEKATLTEVSIFCVGGLLAIFSKDGSAKG